jgi:hypothetical protein
MSLPIEESALAAQSKAEHEYGERLMDLAESRAIYARRDLVIAEDVRWAAMRAMDSINDLSTRLTTNGKTVRCICAEKYGAKVSEG